jgi:hypothetical protein
MTTIVTRSGKGSALSFAEVDGNFTNLNADKVEKNGTDPVVISANSSSDALRITQTGAGNALVVEDSTNPDSTPFVIDTNGKVLAGQAVGYATFGDYLNTARNPQIQYSGTTTPGAMMSIANWSNLASSPATLNLAKSRGAAVGSQAVVLSGDDIGVLEFSADDGTNFVPAAAILAEVDGTPGTNDMPGRLVFSTTADGASSPTERMRINNAGQIGFNSANLGGASGQYRFAGNITGAVSVPGILYTPTVQSDVTTAASVFQSQPSTQDAAFTLADLRHFGAFQGTITGGSRTAPTNQIGFFASSGLIGATNNYGFRSDIAAGTGRWNFYAAGTAENFFGGNTVISVTDNTNAALRITQTGTGNALVVEDSTNPDSTPFVVDASGNVLVGGTAARGTTAGTSQIQLFNGTAPAGTLTNGVSLYSSSGDLNFMDSAGNGYKVGYRNIPAVGTKTSSYTLATSDVGKYVQVGTSGSITIPDATFAEGDSISIFNNTTGNITITCSITTAYIAGTDADKATVTLATRGVATILFISSTICVITGNVS